MRLLQIALPGIDSDLMHPLIDAGLLPHLAQVVEGGGLMSFRSTQPLTHDPVEISLYTGTAPELHGCPAAVTKSGRSWHAKDLKTPAIWHVLDHLEERTVTVGCPATYGGKLTHGVQVPALFGAPGFLPSRALMDLCDPQADLLPDLAELWLTPEESPTDIIRWIVGGTDKAFEHLDEHRIGHFASHLAHTLSLHSAALAALDRCSPSALIVSYPLMEVLSPYLAYCCPPDQLDSDSVGAVLFSQTINRAFQVLDQLIGALLAATSSDTTVCVTSGYGYWTHKSRHTGQNSAADTRVMPWNRGWAAFGGPTIRPDSLVSGARIYDVAPTVLTALRLSPTTQMRGVPQAAILQSSSSVEREQIAPSFGKYHHFPDHPEPVSIDGTIEKFLTSLDDYPPVLLKKPEYRSEMDFEFRWQNILSMTESLAAADLEHHLQQLSADYPNRVSVAIALITTQLDLGRKAQAKAGALALLADYPGFSLAHALVARCEYECGESDLALERLASIEEMQFFSHWEELSARFALTDIYLRAGDLSAGLRQLHKLVVLAPDNARAHRGVCDVSLRLGLLEDAGTALAAALKLDSQSPDGYSLKANLLMARGEYEAAIVALRVCLKVVKPQNHVLKALIQAHQLLGYGPSTWRPYQEQLENLPELLEDHNTSSGDELAADFMQPPQEGDAFDLQEFAAWDNIPEVAEHFHVVTSQDPSDLVALSKLFKDADVRHVGAEDGVLYNEKLAEVVDSPKALDDLVGHVLILPPRVLKTLPDIHRYEVHWLKRESFDADTLALCSSSLPTKARLDDEQNNQLLLLAQATLLSEANNAFHMQVSEYSALEDITKNVVAA